VISVSEDSGGGGSSHFGKWLALFVVLIGIFAMYSMFKKAKSQAA
jgi:hypothetical protein